MKTVLLISAILVGFLAACAPSMPTVPPTTQTPVLNPTIVSSTGYRPLQKDDVVEGARIAYQYILPSQDKPVVVIAFGSQLLQLVTVKTELSNGLVAYIQDLVREPRSIYAFDEAEPRQSEPKLLTMDAKKPVEIAIIPMVEGAHNWSVTEKQEGEERAAYKLIRRKDGGLRFVDAYDMIALQSMSFPTFNGSGAGLVFSSRLALLQLILSDAKYQRGEDVMSNPIPEASQYDPRVLKVDPSQRGLMQNVDWVLVSRPGPNPGLVAP